ncbi:hypothetical protein NDU88_000381 [Pleurodeles waltl]|uniref:Uncharacterized protein n=1 Tax=Pleurodeles waltl TaxID=8319 RepID=A0AAV7S7C5_PLEWA|nr:hypothetical protein NDU88_000381 [Pleurodeles waltl]
MVDCHGPKTIQLNKMDKYAVVVATTGLEVEGGRDATPPTEMAPSQEPSLREIMAVIKDLRGAIESKLDAITINVILLRADFKKMTKKMAVAETCITTLQASTKKLEALVLCLTNENALNTAKLEDQDGRDRRYNMIGEGP